MFGEAQKGQVPCCWTAKLAFASWLSLTLSPRSPCLTQSPRIHLLIFSSLSLWSVAFWGIVVRITIQAELTAESKKLDFIHMHPTEPIPQGSVQTQDWTKNSSNPTSVQLSLGGEKGNTVKPKDMGSGGEGKGL